MTQLLTLPSKNIIENCKEKVKGIELTKNYNTSNIELQNNKNNEEEKKETKFSFHFLFILKKH
jgi:hypothetical protein